MSRHQYLTVLFEVDIQHESAQAVADAIRLLRGVQAVEVGKPVDLEDHLARERVRTELGQQLLDVVYPPRKEPR